MAPHQDKDRLEHHVTETNESINARLEGAKASQGQIRFTLGMMAVISMMMLIASYNAYFSYDYHWIVGEELCKEANFPLNCRCGPPEANPLSSPSASRSEEISGILREQALKDWASSRIVLISLLGIRVSVDDAPVLGTSVLLILSVWLLLWARRENHTIWSLLHDPDEGADEKQSPYGMDSKVLPTLYSRRAHWLIFHTINSNSIFLTVYPSLSSVNSHKSKLKENRTIFKRWFNKLGVGLNKVGFGFLRSFFFLFPVVASLIVFAIDRRSYHIPDPFNAQFGCPGIVDQPFYWWSWLVFPLFLAPLVGCCWKSKRYSSDTAEELRQYKSKLDSDHSELEQSSQD